MRLIDAEKIGLTDMEIVMCEGSSKKALEMLLNKILNAPTIDAIPIIRCKDCKNFVKGENESDAWEWCFYWHEETEEDGYCHMEEMEE